ncbi:MAG TPA: DMT family protein [Candidatus Binatia bacterium]
MPSLSPAVQTILLLVCSNVFMTFAWYGHLKSLRGSPLVVAVLVSWLIALAEYAFQVPANRIGYGRFTLAQLKVLQEIITMSVFAGYAVLWAGEALRWNYLGAGLCLVAAAMLMFRG